MLIKFYSVLTTMTTLSATTFIANALNVNTFALAEIKNLNDQYSSGSSIQSEDAWFAQ